MESHLGRVDVLPDRPGDVDSAHQTPPRGLGHAFGERGIGQRVQASQQGGRHRKETGAHGLVVGEALSEIAHVQTAAPVVVKLIDGNLGGVVDVVDAGELAVHPEQGQSAGDALTAIRSTRPGAAIWSAITRRRGSVTKSRAARTDSPFGFSQSAL